MKKIKVGRETICAADAVIEDDIRPHLMPVYATSTYLYESPEKAAKSFLGKNEQPFIYGRWSHPNAKLIEQKIAALESYGMKNNATALAFGSGMAAISALFQGLLNTGDAVLAQGNIYGTTIDYLNFFSKKFGIQVIYADLSKIEEVDLILKRNKSIKLIYGESPSNPTIRCLDLFKLQKVAKKYKCKTCIDNTFCTAIIQQPLAFGIDFVVYSATKFINGHGNSLAGVIVSGDAEFMQNTFYKIRKLHGSIISPFDAWILNNGIKTLPLRMEAHSKNALRLAEFVSTHPKVKKVYYPGLPQDSDHNIAKKQMKYFGGMLAFEIKGGRKEAFRVLRRLRLCRLTASLGTCDTLIQHPASMSHSFVPPQQREQYQITEGLLRMSVGLENPDDLIEDLSQALS
ncbi:MAG: aminotransferase class I/II-fold pyridoxal phosphate-dependent enzyme [Chitinophagales bacterium]|nr:aminotransferase class I/II-fold pyridoxal phosphate-dependent enzyme [Chitinophagales bacterium]MDW8272656.1 aminotransferase class I/II-fold pyridoxal phosphate-dependent enzyme [Chitinophagales bacterium]